METKWYLQLIKGILLILIAILVFMSPEGAMLSWAVYIGLGMVLTGIFIIIFGFTSKGVLDNWGWRVLEGVLDIFFGVVLLSNPGVTAAVLPFVIGFWGAFYGIMLFVDAFTGDGSAGFKIIGGILIFIASTIIMFNPIFGGLTLAIWFGATLLIAGITNVILSFSSK